MKDNIKKWWKAAGIRAAKTAAQTAVASVPVTQVTLGEVAWVTIASTAAVAAILSLLTSVAGLPEVDDGTSVVDMPERK